MDFESLKKELALLGYVDSNVLRFENDKIVFVNDNLEIHSDLSLYETDHNGLFELCIVESVDDVIFYIEEN